ncbi:MAG TPA: hypothetical protein DCX14_02465 [Flavobacteriales bacterium]|nr:hypothetical protein [Flavobacteriales bacterium]
MKIKTFTFLFAATMMFAATSCNKCVTCDSCPDGVTLEDDMGNEVDSQEICEDDAASKEEYDAGIAIIEAIGCSCK